MQKFLKISTGDTKLYIEGEIVNPEMRGQFMDDETYTAVLDNTIIVCTDTVIINRERRTFFLAKRAVRPMAGIWWIGGRRKKGETPTEGIHRNFKRETNLDLNTDRFKFIAITEYIWQDREQKPYNKGSQNFCHQFFIELTEKELNKAKKHLEQTEYDSDFGLQEFDRNRLIQEKVHPVILDVFDKIFP
jgi:hypothetical protein